MRIRLKLARSPILSCGVFSAVFAIGMFSAQERWGLAVAFVVAYVFLEVVRVICVRDDYQRQVNKETDKWSSTPTISGTMPIGVDPNRVTDAMRAAVTRLIDDVNENPEKYST